MLTNSALCTVSLHLLFITSCFIDHVSSAGEGDLELCGNPCPCPANTTLIPSYTKTSSGVRIGELKENLDKELITNNRSGLFFIPSPSDGVLINMRVFGLNASTNMTSSSWYLYAVVYRRNATTNVYKQHLSPTLITHRLSPNSTQLDLPVQRGDLIGVLIPSDSNSGARCPSQVNLLAEEGTCSTAFFNPMDNIDELQMNISATEFDEVLVYLNVEIQISDLKSLPQYAIILLVVAGFVIFAIAIITIAICIACHIIQTRSRRSKEGTPEKLCIDGKANLPERAKVSNGGYELQSSIESSIRAGEGNTNIDRMAAIPEKDDIGCDDGYDLQGSTHSSISPQHEYDDTHSYEMPTGSQDSYSYTEVEEEEPKNVYKGPVKQRDFDTEKKLFYENQELFIKPANEENDLMEQLNSQLHVTEIPRKEIKLLNELGSGAFGVVYKGVWSHSVNGSSKEEEVAVKTMREELTDEERVKFLQEAMIMGQFNQAYVVSLRGITDNPKMIVLDLMEGGDLREYLLTRARENLKTMHPLEFTSTLLSYMRQVALGMHCFVRKSYIHRDLAARNVLMSGDGTTCKIADFGLSRDLQDQNFYVSHGGRIPVKWTAPEALKRRKYSAASDVWSYGCVLYEIWSLGEKPFQELTNQEAMKYIMAGKRLPPPPGCPRAIYELMIKCWHPNMEERPNFCQVLQLLQKSDYLLLKWSVDDTNTYSQEARTLGSPLEWGKELYKELQGAYLNHEKPQ